MGKLFILLLLFFSSYVCGEIPLNEFYIEYANSQKNVRQTIPPMEYALRQNYDHLVSGLIKKADSISYQQTYGYKNLYGARISIFESIILHDKVELLKQVLPEYISDKDIQSVDDKTLSATSVTLLQWAVARSDLNFEFCHFLLDMGANPNYCSTIGSTGALAIAIGQKNIELSILLLEYDADPNLSSGSDLPLYIAVKNNFYDGVVLLLAYGANVTQDMIYVAANNGNRIILDLLIESDN